MESFGHNSFIYKPLYVSGTNIHIGDNVYVQYKSWLASESLTGNGEALLKIGNGCVIGHFNEIYSTHSIVIENHVLTADRVYISDNIHGYENIEIPILHQPIVQKKRSQDRRRVLAWGWCFSYWGIYWQTLCHRFKCRSY